MGWYNPYAAMEGGDKPALMAALLQDVDLRVGARFGHHHEFSQASLPLGRRVQVAPGEAEEVLKGLLRGNTAG